MVCQIGEGNVIITKLQTAFLDLLHAMKGSGMKLIVGGGFGIYLKNFSRSFSKGLVLALPC